jgi:hypothetical protein
MSPMLSAPAAIPATRQPAFRSALTPGPARDLDVLADQGHLAGPFGQRHQWDQPGPRNEIPVIKRRLHPRRAMEQSHLTGAP